MKTVLAGLGMAAFTVLMLAQAPAAFRGRRRWRHQ